MIRPATIDDARAIARIHVQAWRKAYRGILPDEYLAGLSEEKKTVFWQNQLSAGLGVTFVALNDETIVGWASGGPGRDNNAPDLREIYAIYVDPAHWRQGVGRALMTGIETALADASVHFLWILRENAPAFRFYTTLGYRPDGGEKQAVFGHVTFTELRLSKPAK